MFMMSSCRDAPTRSLCPLHPLSQYFEDGDNHSLQVMYYLLPIDVGPTTLHVHFPPSGGNFRKLPSTGTGNKESSKINEAATIFLIT